MEAVISIAAAPGAGFSETADFLKVFQKEVVLAHNASPLFRAAPYLIFGCLCAAAAIVPTLGTDLPLNAAASSSRSTRAMAVGLDSRAQCKRP
mgnify:CR=1 FL=1